jgi:hypothetical protein
VTALAPTGSGPRPASIAIVVAVQWRFIDTAKGASVLTICVNGSGAEATLHRNDSDEVVASAGPTSIEMIDGLEHVSVPGILTATLRRAARGSGGVTDVLYARTPLLEMLGVRGGCSEPPELARVENQSAK